MASSKRKRREWDPTRSDSDDEDFNEKSSPRPRPQGRLKKVNDSARKPVKRARKEAYGDSEDDIEADDDDEISEEGSFADSSEHEVAIERNPKTGRSVRSVAKKPTKYEELSEDEIEAVDSDRTPARGKRVAPAAPKPKKRLVVKLGLAYALDDNGRPVKMDGKRTTRARTGSRGTVKREPTPQTHSAMGTRRSSRISHDEQAPLVALTNSGHHETVARAGTQTPEPPNRRPTRGSKGLKKPPVSAIMEASFEDSGVEQPGIEGEDIFSQLQVASGELETLVQRTSPQRAVAGNEDDIQMEEVDMEEEQVVQESQEDNDEDDGPVARGSRALRSRRKASTPPTSQPLRTSARRQLRTRKPGVEQSSDFEPDHEAEAEVEENVSESDDLLKPNRGRSSNDDSQGGRRSGRLTRKAASQRSRSGRQRSDDDIEEELDADEVADEAADLEEDHRRNKRTRKRPATRSEIAFEPNLRNRGNRPDYRILRPELLLPVEDDDANAAAISPQRNKRGGGGGGAYRSLFSTYGPFGGAGGPPPVFGGPDGAAAAGGVDSDSSDDEMAGRGGQHGVGGTAGMTPTSAFPKPFVPHNSDALQGPGGGPPGLGKVKDRKALADADPLGVDTSVSFEGVGGLDGHIDRLKEMVALPLLYPEVFMQFKMTPPRGVLFHGPPGTGKTLLARALASSVSTQGQKVTFYMRKGADALSKWVGEAEKQLRLLFEEARKNQPSIIFFDEIDGLAPVRSSKQEQIHASIVATLLALMDGMDGRGQVIVIGATNRPDSVDPALRRPGRFDREFYFPLPDQKARRSIIDIHTKGWEPPLQPPFKDQLAEITRGYGGADLRALCTEAALNAVQGTYPQIYSSNQKLVIDPTTIKVLAKDFMISVNKIVPSSERSAASGSAPLKKDVEPLLREPLTEVARLIDEAVPLKRKATALEEAMYDDRDDEGGFERETMARHFESARVYRPRLLIRGQTGMGQQYLGAALLSKFEGLHVQSFDMGTLMKDSTRSPEAAIVQLFEEVKRHKPSVIYLPNVDILFQTLSESAIRTFTGLLRSLPPTDPVLVLGIMDREPDEKDDIDMKMLHDLFGYSQKNQYILKRPGEPARLEYFDGIIDLIRKTPTEFPDGENRKKRKLEVLPVAPLPDAPKGPTKAEEAAQKKKDRLTLNWLKIWIQRVMDHLKTKYKKFRTPVIDEGILTYLYDEQDPELVTTDLSEEQRQQQQLFRPYEIDKDLKGNSGLREVASGKFYYNLEMVTIEKRLSNGYYKRPRDFTSDIKCLAKDAKTLGDQERTIKANEMLANVEVDMAELESQHPALAAECEAVYHREQERERLRLVKEREAERMGKNVPMIVPNVPPINVSKTTTESSGPVMLGQEVPGGRAPLLPFTPHRMLGVESVSHWSTNNGSLNGSHPSHQTNGSTVPSRPHDDSEMLDSQPDLYDPLHPRLPWGSAGSPSQPNTQGQRSQKSVHQQIAHGSQLDQYQNSASTTTSGQRTTDKSNRSSGPSVNNTQYSNGIRGVYPNLSTLAPVIGGSQLLDTQPEHCPSSQSQPDSQSSQPMAPPAPPPPGGHRQHSINNILNDPPEGAQQQQPKPPPQRILLDLANLELLRRALVKESSGCSLEQLEQINACLMDVVWRHRSDWNRNHVIKAVEDAFNEKVLDIEACQGIEGPSQESPKR